MRKNDLPSKEILDNHEKYVARITLFKSYGYDIEMERNFIIEKAKPLHGKILEVGTGKGHFALTLAKEGHPFITIDISKDDHHFAKLNLAYFGFEKLADFRIENAERTSFPDGSFDTIFSVNVLHHLRNPYRVVDELTRMLSPNGKLILSDFTEDGFKIMDEIHALDGNAHERGNAATPDVEAYLTAKGFFIAKTKSRIQEILIVEKKINEKMEFPVFHAGEF